MDAMTCGAVVVSCVTTIVCTSLAFARRVLEREEAEDEAAEPTLPKLREEVRRLAKKYDAIEVWNRAEREAAAEELAWAKAKLAAAVRLTK